MISGDAYNYINILNKAASASWKKNELIANNIANVDTPDYKRKDLNFESLLTSAMTQTGTQNMDQKVKNINLAMLNPKTYTEFSTLDYRYDGNNVDIDTENAYLADNQLKYYAYINSINNEFERLKMAMSKN